MMDDSKGNFKIKKITSVSIIVLFISSIYFSVLAEMDNELTTENTVILSNKTDEAFCKDFSPYLRKLSVDWVDVQKFREIKDKNIIIIGGPDAEDIGDIVRKLITQEEAEHIRRNGSYSILKKDNPWTEKRVIYIFAGSDRVFTKKAAEMGMETLIQKVKNPEDWFRYSFSICSLEEAQEYIAQFQFIPEDKELSTDELSIELNAHLPEHITVQEAKEDVEYLFYLLSHGYSGYGYFKTKGDFDQAKKDILSEIETRSTLTPESFSGLLHKHLEFIRDGHFMVGHDTYFQHKVFWYDKNFEIWKTGEKYYFISDNKMWEIVKINKKDPKNFIFPSLNPNGEPIYRIGVLSKISPNPLILIAKDENGVEKIFEINLYSSNYTPKGIFEECKISGIPVISIRSFSTDYIDQLEKFLQTAKKYRGEPYLILDIRGNGGGSSEWPRKWVKQFTGYNPEDFIHTMFLSRTTLIGNINYIKQHLKEYPDNEIYRELLDRYEGLLDKFERNSDKPHWSEITFPSIQTIPNTTKVIVLMDGRVCSAGEAFINYLRQIENVIFVGENSCGMITFGDNTLHQLPNSKLSVCLPSTLLFPPDLKLIEEEGFFPDLWVPADYALFYVLNAIEKGKI